MALAPPRRPPGTKTGVPSKTNNRRVNKAENQKVALDMRRKGYTFQEISAHIGVTKAMAWRYVMDAFTALKEQNAEVASELRVITNDRIETAIDAIWPEVQNGTSTAINSLVKLLKLQVRIWGLEAPQEIKVTVDALPLEERAAKLFEIMEAGKQRMLQSGQAPESWQVVTDTKIVEGELVGDK